MADIRIENLSKSFWIKKSSNLKEIKVIENFSLTVNKGEFVALFGPNGSGKSTLLNILAGIESYSKGDVKIGGLEPNEATIGYIFQNFRESLLPWRKNIDLISLPLELKGISREERYKIAQDILSQFDISLPLDTYPYQLSGGQQQLLAICMALASKTEVLLMDEPFAGLSYYNRILIQKKILDIWSKAKLTIMMISHDLEESIFLANRVVMISKLPARIMDIVKIDIPYPRTDEHLRSNRFFELKNRLIEIAEKTR